MKFETPERNLPLAIIAESDIIRKLATIFEDSVILDGRFQIVMVSSPILRTLGYAIDELEGQSINRLGRADEDLQPVLQAALGTGFFEEIVVSLLTHKGKPIVFGVSGFYLGLISDYNGYIVLKLKNLDIIRQLNQQLEDNRIALDKFIYRTAHDLRGPVATIRGLIHMLKNRPDDTELGLLADMLEVNATQLDDRLFKLLYLAESGSQQPPCGVLNIDQLERGLREILNQSGRQENTLLMVKASRPVFECVQEQHVTALLNNLMLYLVQLSGPAHASLDVYLFQVAEGLSIRMRPTGFESGDILKNLPPSGTSAYSEVLSQPDLVHYFAAQKIAVCLQADIRLHFIGTVLTEISIQVPFHPAAQP